MSPRALRLFLLGLLLGALLAAGCASATIHACVGLIVSCGSNTKPPDPKARLIAQLLMLGF